MTMKETQIYTLYMIFMVIIASIFQLDFTQLFTRTLLSTSIFTLPMLSIWNVAEASVNLTVAVVDIFI